MSDSDDTDVLLQIPPGIFIDSAERNLELSSFQTQVVGGLLEHVNELETRVSLIESINNSFGNNSFVEIKSFNSMVLNDCDTSVDSSLRVNEEHLNQEDLVSPSCALTTCDINSHTESSLDLQQRDNVKSTSKEALLKEIDVYLENIRPKSSQQGEFIKYDVIEKSIEKRPEGLMSEDMATTESSLKRLDLPEVDRLLKEMENTQMEIENKLRMREIEYGLGNQNMYSNVSSRKSYPVAERATSYLERNSAPFSSYKSPMKLKDLDKARSYDDMEVKRDLYLVGSSQNSDSDDAKKNGFPISESTSQDTKPRSVFENKNRFVSPRRKLFHSDNMPLRKPPSGHSSEITSSSSRANIHRDYFPTSVVGDEIQNPLTRDYNMLRGKDTKFTSQNSNDLLSLAELWKSERDISDDDTKKLRQKLEEEKIRRIHLESTIQDLQKRVLEEQERLAVAVKVDEGKDKAISQITNAWKQMVNHWREIEADRHAISQTVIKEKALIKQKEEEVNKKVERWEKEVSQALDLAAGYKSKFEMLETELSSTIEVNNVKTKEFEGKLKNVEEELHQLYEERKILTDKLNLTQEEHEKEKQLVELAQKEISSLQEMLKNNEAELTIVKEQRDLLSTRLREEKGKSSNLEKQKTELQESLNETKLKLNEVEEVLKNSTANYEKSRVELKALFQGQLEAVVKEKLDEFQGQLDKAQEAMKLEITEARRLAQEQAAAKNQALMSSHTVEIRRMEARFKEEMRNLEKKLAESESRREKLESGKRDIAQKLHGLMEAQWKQAINIISGEISLRQDGNDSIRQRFQVPNDNKIFKIDPSELESSFEEQPYLKEVMNANRQQVSKHDTLLKYIQMLLDKQPGKPVDSASSEMWPDATPNDTVDESMGEQKWNQIISNPGSFPTNYIQESVKQDLPNQRKPPWK